jgi:hypothetical protein
MIPLDSDAAFLGAGVPASPPARRETKHCTQAFTKQKNLPMAQYDLFAEEYVCDFERAIHERDHSDNRL